MRGEDRVVDTELIQQRYAGLLAVFLAAYGCGQKDEGAEADGAERLKTEKRGPLDQIRTGNLVTLFCTPNGIVEYRSVKRV